MELLGQPLPGPHEVICGCALLPRKLISIAFGDLNPFPLRQIRNRRAFHLEKVRLELMELEAIREDFLRGRETDPDKRDLISDDEEDG